MHADPSAPSREDGSWFGRVTLAAPGEAWPTYKGVPLGPRLQIRLDEAPYVPTSLRDLALITFFTLSDDSDDIAADLHDVMRELGVKSEIELPNGQGWLIRTYQSLDGLVPIATPSNKTWLSGTSPVRWEFVERDLPESLEFADMPEVSENWPDAADEARTSTDVARLGGWPSVFQRPLPWGPLGKAIDWQGKPYDWTPPAFEPEFVLELGSVDEVSFYVDDGGTMYLGRGTNDASQWCLTWDAT